MAMTGRSLCPRLLRRGFGRQAGGAASARARRSSLPYSDAGSRDHARDVHLVASAAGARPSSSLLLRLPGRGAREGLAVGLIGHNPTIISTFFSQSLRWNSSEERDGDGPQDDGPRKLRESSTVEELIDAMYDNLDSASSYYHAFFWDETARLLKKRQKARMKLGGRDIGDRVNDVRDVRRRLESILDKTIEQMDAFHPDKLAQMAVGLARIMTLVRPEGEEEEGDDDDDEKDKGDDTIESLLRTLLLGEDPKPVPKDPASNVYFAKLVNFSHPELNDAVRAFDALKESHPTPFRKLANAAIERPDDVPSPSVYIALWAHAVAKRKKLDRRTLANFLLTSASNGLLDRRLYESLLPTAESLRPKCTQPNLGSVAWSLAAANVPAPELFGRPFMKKATRDPRKFRRDYLWRLHQWELWQEELGEAGCRVRLPPFMKKRCRQSFLSKQWLDKDPSMQEMRDDVVHTLESIGLETEADAITERGFRLDITVEANGAKVGVDVDGPSRFVGGRPDGESMLKRRQLSNLEGIRVVSVPCREWERLETDDEKREYLRSLLDLPDG